VLIIATVPYRHSQTCIFRIIRRQLIDVALLSSRVCTIEWTLETDFNRLLYVLVGENGNHVVNN